jgi:hypothetical protein
MLQCPTARGRLQHRTRVALCLPGADRPAHALINFRPHALSLSLYRQLGYGLTCICDRRQFWVQMF